MERMKHILNINVQQQIDTYLDLVIEANKSLNLTRIDTRDQGQVLHIEDSLAALDIFKDAPDGLYGDLGSGGGFPGVPLALATGRQTLLVDSVKKKMAAVLSILTEMGVTDQIQVYDGRIEDLARDKKYAFSILTARALTSLPSLLELASPLLKTNGIVICYKSHISDDELQSALIIQDMLGLKMIDRRQYYLSDQETYRELLLFKKVHKEKLKLPRRVGLAQKHPLEPR